MTADPRRKSVVVHQRGLRMIKYMQDNNLDAEGFAAAAGVLLPEYENAQRNGNLPTWLAVVRDEARLRPNTAAAVDALLVDVFV